jgi:hypothetical protein
LFRIAEPVMRIAPSLILVLAALPALAAEPARNTVLTLGKPSGEETREQRGDEVVVAFRFNDRGRGPELSARWTLDATGIPTAIRIEGKSYLKSPVDERFARAPDGTATWSNENEEGERSTAGNAFYIPANAPPSYYAVLVRALAKAPDHELPLLPAGEARLERVAEREVTLADPVPRARGDLAAPFQTSGFDVRFELSGNDLADLYAQLDLALPPESALCAHSGLVCFL